MGGRLCPRIAAFVAITIATGLAGCRLILPLAQAPGDTSPDARPGDVSPPDASPPDVPPPDIHTPPMCTPAVEGRCNPDNTGEVCLQGVWRLPPCTDTLTGCGEPHGSSSTGYCDPNWTGCVAAQTDVLNCDEYCDDLGKKCCDTKKHTSGDCTADQYCITSRGYGAGTAVHWGAESWNTSDECDDAPGTMGVGQHYCDGTNANPPWTPGSPVRYRCCCFER